MQLNIHGVMERTRPFKHRGTGEVKMAVLGLPEDPPRLGNLSDTGFLKPIHTYTLNFRPSPYIQTLIDSGLV